MKKKISKLMFVLVMIVSVFAVTQVCVFAESGGTCGKNLMWTFDMDGTLTISGYGDMYNYFTDSQPWSFLKNDIQTIVIEDGVTSIGDYAFYHCKNLTNVKISNDVTGIGSYAFHSCENLKDVTIPDNVTRIGMYSFVRCKSLTNLTLPYGITDIKMYSFYGCAGLTSIVIPDSVTTIETAAFENCTGLKSVMLSSNLTNIGIYAFNECTSLVDLQIPNSVISIGKYAFSGCANLKSITLPDSITVIEDNAFKSCDSLEFVYYAGTQYEWFEITIGANNECLTDSSIECEAEGTPNKVSVPVSSVNSGNVLKGQKIELTSPNSNAEIYYTINGNMPTTNSLKYTKAITVNYNMVIRAMAVENGVASNIVEYKYTVVDKLKPSIKVTSVRGVADGVVEVDILMENNPKVAVVGFDLTYDNRTILAFNNVKNGNVFNEEDMGFDRVSQNLRFTFLNCNNIINENGVLCTVTFYINSKGIDGDYSINIENLECYDIDENMVGFASMKGMVDLVDNLVGDVNGDKKITKLDLLNFAKYFAGQGVYIVKENSDINGDGNINDKDLLMLSNYFAGWDIEL